MKFKVGTKEYDIKDDLITKAITDGTSVMTLVEDAIVRTQAEDSKFVENMKKEARVEGVEIAVKKIRDEKGLEFTGKTIENLIEASNAKTLEEAKIEPNDKIKKLTEKLVEKETALTAALAKAAEVENREKAYRFDVSVNAELEKYIPENTLLPKDDIKTILKSKITFKQDDEGKTVAYDSSGNVIKNDSTKDPLDLKDVVEGFFRDNTHYVNTTGGGRGKGDSGSGKTGDKISIEDFISDLKGKGIEINSAEYDAEMSKAIEAKTLDV